MNILRAQIYNVQDRTFHNVTLIDGIYEGYIQFRTSRVKIKRYVRGTMQTYFNNFYTIEHIDNNITQAERNDFASAINNGFAPSTERASLIEHEKNTSKLHKIFDLLFNAYSVKVIFKDLRKGHWSIEAYDDNGIRRYYTKNSSNKPYLFEKILTGGRLIYNPIKEAIYNQPSEVLKEIKDLV